MMMSSCDLKMAITFDRIIFLIWGRPYLESEIKYLLNGVYFFYNVKSNIFQQFLMTSSFSPKIAITFDGMIFWIWGRPSLESAQKYNITVYNTLGFGEKKCLPKNADVSSHVTYGRGSLKKSSEYVNKHLCQVSCFFHNLKYYNDIVL